MSKDKTHSYTKQIKSSEIEQLISSALNGMGYWADEVNIMAHPDFPAPEWMQVSQALTHNRPIAIHIIDEDRWRKLDLKRLLNGLSLTNDLDLENYDMYDAERVIQRALFKKEVYA